MIRVRTKSPPANPARSLTRVAFCCSSLEPGQDGVGDYTRRLAAELTRRSHSVIIIALNDPHANGPEVDSQEIEGTVIPVMRLHCTMPWDVRLAESRNWLKRFSPGWMSLQFVPFGFHRKGLCFGLGKSLTALNPNAAWHVMFHELWVGLDENAPWKHRLWGAMQRKIILNLAGRLRPRLVHTHAESYRAVLAREKINASILPLFGNILPVGGDGWSLLEPLIAKAPGRRLERGKYYLAGVFGAVHPQWSAKETVNLLLPLARRAHKRLVLVFHGKNSCPPEFFDQLRWELPEDADMVTAGERSNLEISRILQTLDLGLATTPLQLIQKSGSVAAMLEHGLPVLVTRDDWRLRGASVPMTGISPRLLSAKQFALLDVLPMRNPWSSADNGAGRIADQMLESMKRI